MNYKLKKWYPSLPKDWKVGMEVGAGLLGFEDRYSPCDTKYIGRFIYKNEVENNPEFWEKVEYVDLYEILKLQWKSRLNENKILDVIWYEDGLPIKHIRDGYEIAVDHTLPYCKYSKIEFEKLIDILEIKRKDGVIFKIGDKVTNPNSKSQTFVIEKFYLDCEGRHMLAGPGHIGIHKIEHCKEPVFVTEDGISIFDVNTPTYFVDCNYIIGRQSIGYIFHNYLKYFSTKEKAEEYIDLNKPKFCKFHLLDFLTRARIIFEIPQIKYTIENYTYFVRKWMEDMGMKNAFEQEINWKDEHLPKFSKKEIMDIINLDGEDYTDGEIIDKIYELIKSK